MSCARAWRERLLGYEHLAVRDVDASVRLNCPLSAEAVHNMGGCPSANRFLHSIYLCVKIAQRQYAPERAPRTGRAVCPNRGLWYIKRGRFHGNSIKHLTFTSRGSHCLAYHGSQRGAIFKSPTANTCYRTRDLNRCQRGATFKSVIVNSRNRTGNLNRGQRGAIIKSLGANTRNRTGNLNRGQRGAKTKSIGANTRNRTGYYC